MMWSFENPAIRNGIFAGLGSAALIVVLYLFNPRWIFYVASILTTALFIYFMVQSVRSEKAVLEHTSFGDALKPAFLCYAVGHLIYIAFYFLLLNYIAPELLVLQKEIAMESIEKMGSLLGEEAMEEAIDQLEAKGLDFGFRTALWSLAWGLIFPGFLISLIIAAIMQDRKKVDL